MKRLIAASVTAIGSAVFCLTDSAAGQEAAPAVLKPNVIVIVADDLGYADIGAQGISKDVRTPHIDSIAANGVRFTNGYVSCPVCSPTRAGLLTGRYQQRFGFEQNHTAQNRFEYKMPADQILLPEVLKKAGYVTGMVGKWHQGEQDEASPTKRGFDEFFGFRGGAHSYINNEEPAVKDPNAIRRGDTPVGEKEYLTDAFSREAVAFVERHKGEPFFLYLAYNAPHTPVEVTEKYLNRFPDEREELRRKFLAMMSSMDDGVGQVLAKLREHKIEDNTIVMFISDNGGEPLCGTRNTPLRGRKGATLEGGVRVPFYVQWKDRYPTGKVDDRVVVQLDLFPTIVAAAGGQMPTDRSMDGVDLTPYLTGQKQGTIHETLYWRFGPRRGMRSGDWKLWWNGNAKPQLFDLSKDIGETTDLASANPQKVEEMMASYNAWSAQMMEPRWEGNLEGDGGNARRPAAGGRRRPATRP